MRKPMILSIAVLLLSACAAPAIHYYQLPDSVFRQPAPAKQANTVALKVDVADFLSGDALIYQTTPETVHFAGHHLWAGRLDEAAAGVLANALNDAPAVSAYVLQRDHADCPCIRVFLQRFQGRHDGTVQVAGYARFFDRDGKPTHTRNFLVEKAQQGDGYAAMVKALNDALKDAAAQIMQ